MIRTLVLLVLSSVLVTHPCRATTWIAPQRPLTDDEWLQYDISGADAIGIGVIAVVHDTTLNVAQNGCGISYRYLTLRIDTWLKGDPGISTVLAGLSPLEDNPLHGTDLLSAADMSQKVAFFLRRSGDGWGLCDGPDPAGAGMRLVPHEDAAALAQRLRALIASQAIDSILTHAQTVVVGHRIGGGRCFPDSNIWCTRILVERSLTDTPVADTLSVFFKFLGQAPTERALFLLRPMGRGVYAPVGFKLACQPITGDRVSRWGLSLTEIATRLQRVRGDRRPRSGPDR